MSAAHDPAPMEQLRIGPVKVVEIFMPPAPPGQHVADSIGNETVPFDQIRNLVSDKPLRRATGNEPGR